MSDTRPACRIHKPTYDDRCQDCYVAALESRLMEQRARGDALEEALSKTLDGIPLTEWSDEHAAARDLLDAPDRTSEGAK